MDERKRKLTDHELIGQSRLWIMGVSILWIMLFHGITETAMETGSVGLDYVCRLGYLGTDMFMFLSGFSMQNSYVKSSNRDSKIFLRKRMKRIIPTFIPCLILYVINYLKGFVNSGNLMNAIHGKAFWIDLVVLRWFVPAICLAYFLTPQIEKIFRKAGYDYRSLLLILIPLLILAVVFQGSSVALMVVTRLMEYVIGFFYGHNIEARSNGCVRLLICMLEFVVFIWLMGRYSYAVMADTGTLWYPAIPAISSMVVLNALVFTWLNRNILGRWIVYGLAKIGGVTLELYLWHEMILWKLAPRIRLDENQLLVNFIAIVVAVLWAFLYKRIIDLLCEMRWGKGLFCRQDDK